MKILLALVFAMTLSPIQSALANKSKAVSIAGAICGGALVLSTMPLIYDNVESPGSRTGVGGATKNSVANILAVMAKHQLFKDHDIRVTMKRNYFLNSEIFVNQQGDTIAASMHPPTSGTNRVTVNLEASQISGQATTTQHEWSFKQQGPSTFTLKGNLLKLNFEPESGKIQGSFNQSGGTWTISGTYDHTEANFFVEIPFFSNQGIGSDFQVHVSRLE